MGLFHSVSSERPKTRKGKVMRMASRPRRIVQVIEVIHAS
jgi:hypothetical protein